MCNNEENKDCNCEKEEKKGGTTNKYIIMMALCLGTIIAMALIGKLMG